MTKIDWTDLVIKMFAVIQVVGIIMLAPSIIGVLGSISILTSGSEYAVPLKYIISILAVLIILPLLIASMVWRFSRNIAEYVWRRSTNSANMQTGNTVSYDKIVQIVISCMGLYILLSSIPGLVYSISVVLGQQELFSNISIKLTFTPLCYSIQAIIGLLLILRPNIFSKVITK